MVPTKAYVEQRFGEFNRHMFGGRLPRPLIVMTNAKTFMGKYEEHGSVSMVRVIYAKDGPSRWPTDETLLPSRRIYRTEVTTYY